MPAHRRSSAPVAFGHRDMGRRRFLGYLFAAPTLAVGVKLGIDLAGGDTASAAIPAPPQPADLYDLSDALTDAARPTANLITVVVNEDGTVSFDLPRAEVGQGITTSIAMIIAEEMDVPLDKVKITLADARPELVFNQLTGGSNTIHAMYTPIRVAAAIAKGALLDAAAAILQENRERLTSREGLITGPAGTVLSYGELAKAAAATETRMVEAPPLKPASEFKIVGTPQNRLDAYDAVTGRKQFAMDLDVPGATPTMVARPPSIGGTVEGIRNEDEVRNMPGVVDIATIRTGVAVAAETFGQCIDAVRALDIEWGPGLVDGESDDTIIEKLRAAAIPLPPGLPGAKVIETDFTFAFRSGSPLETNGAVADVRDGKAEIWYGAKVPITAQAEIALLLGIPQTAVTLHVVQSGGSFGRHLFPDAALEAAEASQKMGRPVKLMWHRTDDARHGRTHPMTTVSIRTSYNDDAVLAYHQHHTSVETDTQHGLGEAISAQATKLPPGNYSVAQSLFLLTAKTSYNFGVTNQLLHEIPLQFPTSSVRNVYSPDVRLAQELVVDQLANAMGQDRYEFRRAYAKTDHLRKVLDKVAEMGDWGRSVPDGVGYGIAVHDEYKMIMACMAEVDARPETVNRPIRNGKTGPRVTKVWYAAIPGSVVVNPRGMEAQLMGGITDAVGLVFTAGLHIKDGIPLEGSWDDYFYTRQWNVPEEINIEILEPDPTLEVPGAGEAGVAAACGAIASAYAAAIGEIPKFFPILHDELGFEPKPLVPPIPESPTNGLDFTF
ncbi:xanthine dehydrogenase family protein molybdopterin-binding subunit [Pseudonocardia bannensis]|uniref:Xanthine dehydrogenase family protein molybdopterin-binding subunit n=1 Tax=Pseudonocardia bannensis TaxID=630973 RepID=A0A848DFZ8_9PSEU|nr:xanthine dehydrogenase family protein molybdopterin-binding subunit [Pseudonocardia bannensis]